ncbi:hypothetical protein A9Q92_05075 [Methylophaga sp. 42_8_T64]|nr:hypothetical protein A9Q78_01835 [Methylophaga sp. 41_12_T18]OUR86916.1 hypothetical protein A9Q92_05075 [Methylophaga sp. 42_8_T64]
MTQIILYTTAGCHLCDLANDLLMQIKQQQTVSVAYVEIGDDDQLVALYGTTIPVLEFSNGSQLNWPFELNDINKKLLEYKTQ